MGLGTLTDNPWHTDSGWTTFQIGQCRLHIHLSKTKEFYQLQPTISQNCSCDNCKYFESIIVKTPNRMFEILNLMEVDLIRQPNINPPGINCIGERKPGKLEYFGNYFVFGQIGKTSKHTQKVNINNTVEEITFKDIEFGKNTQVTIKQVASDKLSFEFIMLVDKNNSI